MVGFRRSSNANCANSANLLALPDVLGASTVDSGCQMLAVGWPLWFGQDQAGIRRKLRVCQPRRAYRLFAKRRRSPVVPDIWKYRNRGFLCDTINMRHEGRRMVGAGGWECTWKAHRDRGGA